MSRWVRELLTQGQVELDADQKNTTGDDLLDSIQQIGRMIDRIAENRRRTLIAERNAAEAKKLATEADSKSTQAVKTANAALASVEGNHNCFTLLAYFSLTGRELDDRTASSLGTRLSRKYRRIYGKEPPYLPHAKWGKVNVYPASMLQTEMGDPPGPVVPVL